MQKIVTPAVSVIVSSHREEYIDELVSFFDSSVCGSIPTEIIIVADYSIDRFKENYHHVRWLFVPEKSISLKRNRGILSAKSNICAFIDDDCIPGKEWIPSAIDYFNNHPEMVGVEGMTEIDTLNHTQGSYREFKRLEKRGFRTNNIFYRKNSLLEVNLFDERFIVQREDVDLAYTIMDAGLLIGYASNIRVTHRYRKNEKWDLLKNCVNRRFDPLLFRKHKKLYQSFIGNPYPPGIQLLFLLHLFLIINCIVMNTMLGVYAAVDVCAIFFLTVRRAGMPFSHNSIQWVREYIAFSLSPFVLTGALLYGSIRFRSPRLLLLVFAWKPIVDFFSQQRDKRESINNQSRYEPFACKDGKNNF